MPRIFPRKLCAFALSLPVNIAAAYDIEPYVEYAAYVLGGPSAYYTNIPEAAAAELKWVCAAHNYSNCKITKSGDGDHATYGAASMASGGDCSCER